MQAFKDDIARDPEFVHARFTAADVAAMRSSARAALDTIFTANAEPNCIVSAEAISTFTIAELADLETFCRRYFDSIRVIIYVRPLKERMESAFQEVLKTRYRSIDDRFPLNYMRMAMNFDEVFGRDCVQFFRFSRDEFPGGSIVNHFLSHVGAPAAVFADERSNSRLSKEAVQLLYAYRKHVPHIRRGDPERVALLSGLDGTPFYFHSSLFHKLLHTGKHASSRFAQRTGFSIETNLEEHDALGIRDETDLLTFAPEAIDWLQGKLGWRGRLKLRRSVDAKKVAEALGSIG